MCVECGKISINACVKKDLFSLTHQQHHTFSLMIKKDTHTWKVMEMKGKKEMLFLPLPISITENSSEIFRTKKMINEKELEYGAFNTLYIH